MKRIGIDARFLGTATGIGRYVEELIKGLAKLDNKNEYIIFLRRENWDKYSSTTPNFKKSLLEARWYTFREQFAAPRAFFRERLDLVHVPHWNVPLLMPTPFVVTVHDLILRHRPTLEASKLSPPLFFIKYLGYRLVLNRAVSRARRIITVSKWTAETLKREMRAPTQKMSVTYEGVRRLPAGDEDFAQKTKEKFGIKKNYIFTVGNFYPHKNLERLVRAYRLLLSDSGFGSNFQLVLAGKDDNFAERLKEKIKAIGGLEGGIVFTGELSDEELGTLLSRAMLYVCASLEEGFGLPGLEAMTLGVPVAAARAGALPEIYGDAALYFDPLDYKKMLAAVSEILNNQLLRDNLVSRGKLRAEKFSWRRMAEETLVIYERALKNL